MGLEVTTRTTHRRPQRRTSTIFEISPRNLPSQIAMPRGCGVVPGCVARAALPHLRCQRLGIRELKSMNFLFNTRNCVSKPRNCAVESLSFSIEPRLTVFVGGLQIQHPGGDRAYVHPSDIRWIDLTIKIAKSTSTLETIRFAYELMT